MMLLIDSDYLQSIKFHPLPYMQITPPDVAPESYKRGWNDVVDVVLNDADPVVRCADCVHRDTRYEWHGDYNCRLHHEPKSLDFFCSDGERKPDLSLGTDNRCVCCGEIIPEGAQVCPTCIREAET